MNPIVAGDPGVAATPWTAADVAAVADSGDSPSPIAHGRAPVGVAGLDLWDPWPVRAPDDSVAVVAGGELWAALTAAAAGHPGGRHAIARIHLLHLVEGTWHDLGPLFPDGASAGSREWAGCCQLVGNRLEVHYTAAGRRGEARPTFEQRIFATAGRLEVVDGRPRVTDWEEHREVLRADGARYAVADQADGEPGFILGFRDPYVCLDPGTGQTVMLFTASSPDDDHTHRGLIGIARRNPEGQWQLGDPLISAVGVNNELERPHLLVRDGTYYVFFSTQARTFTPGLAAPTGLYCFAGSSLAGPLRPVNQGGLVLRNPAEEPFQAYSWIVLSDLEVRAFVDAYGLEGRHPDDLEQEGEAVVRAHFGGTITEREHLVVAGDSVRLLRR